MAYFDEKFFTDFDYTDKQVDVFFDGAKKDINIAKRSDIPEVAFLFSYNALIKIGIALLAANKKKVKSRAGHHIKTIEALDKIIQNTNIYKTGNRMRRKRNTDLYDGGVLISNKDAKELLEFVSSVYEKSYKYLKKKLNKML